MQLLVEFTDSLTFSGNFPHRMQHRGVVAPAKQLTDFRQAFLREFFGQVHGNLTGTGNRGRAFLGIHVGDFDFVIVRHGFLDIFN